MNGRSELYINIHCTSLIQTIMVARQRRSQYTSVFVAINQLLALQEGEIKTFPLQVLCTLTLYTHTNDKDTSSFL